MKILFLYLLQLVLSSNEFMTIEQKILNQFKTKSSKELFKVWHLIFKRPYTLSSDEAKIKFKIFKENLEKIENLNSSPDQKNEYGLTIFSDITLREFEDKYLMKKEVIDQIKSSYFSADPFESEISKSDEYEDDDLTKRNLGENVTFTVDFRPYISEVKNQSLCDSSWAFGAVCLMEFNHYQCLSKVANLSEQFLVDCNSLVRGCNGGTTQKALYFVKHLSVGGIPYAEYYPYVAVNQKCTPGNQTRYKYNGTVEVCGAYNACSLKKFNKMVSKTVVVAFAYASLWALYKGNVYFDDTVGIDPNLVVTIVGMGKSLKGELFYIVRPSLSRRFGNEGYLYYFYDEKHHTPISKYGISIKTDCSLNA